MAGVAIAACGMAGIVCTDINAAVTAAFRALVWVFSAIQPPSADPFQPVKIDTMRVGNTKLLQVKRFDTGF